MKRPPRKVKTHLRSRIEGLPLCQLQRRKDRRGDNLAEWKTSTYLVDVTCTNCRRTWGSFTT